MIFNLLLLLNIYFLLIYSYIYYDLKKKNNQLEKENQLLKFCLEDACKRSIYKWKI